MGSDPIFTSAAGLLHVGVAQLLELFDQPVAVITLDLDDTVLHRAARAALLLELAADFLERGAGQRDAVNGAHTLAAAMRGFLPDADRRWFASAGFHALPPATCEASDSSASQRSMRSAISA